MSNCILCTNVGKVRRYFFDDAPLCDADYASLLEFLIDDMEEEVTAHAGLIRTLRRLVSGHPAVLFSDT
jgi:hypothetical protein